MIFTIKAKSAFTEDRPKQLYYLSKKTPNIVVKNMHNQAVKNSEAFDPHKVARTSKFTNNSEKLMLNLFLGTFKSSRSVRQEFIEFEDFNEWEQFQQNQTLFKNPKILEILY